GLEPRPLGKLARFLPQGRHQGNDRQVRPGVLPIVLILEGMETELPLRPFREDSIVRIGWIGRLRRQRNRQREVLVEEPVRVVSPEPEVILAKAAIDETREATKSARCDGTLSNGRLAVRVGPHRSDQEATVYILGRGQRDVL